MKNRVWLHALASLVMVMILCGCMGIGGGKVLYCFGGVWEIQGNSVSITDAKSADNYTAADGTVHTAPDGNLFVIVECNIRLVDEWKISTQQTINRYGNDLTGEYVLFCDPVEIDSERYALLFQIPKDVFSGNVSDYEVEFRIEKSAESYVSQGFLLTE